MEGSNETREKLEYGELVNRKDVWDKAKLYKPFGSIVVEIPLISGDKYLQMV